LRKKGVGKFWNEKIKWIRNMMGFILVMEMITHASTFHSSRSPPKNVVVNLNAEQISRMKWDDFEYMWMRLTVNNLQVINKWEFPIKI
jgi:hypothetical protein